MFLPNLKLIAVAAGAAAFLMLLWGAYHYGQLSEREAAHKAVIAYQEREATLLNQLEAARYDREIIYRDRIKIVKKAADDCLDRRLPASILDSLRHDLPPS